REVVVHERALLDGTRHFYAFDLRRRTMNVSVRLLLQVFRPFVFHPHGDDGWRPPEVLPSPPPIGWSTGFIDTPRLCGRQPIQRLRPALPHWMLPCSELPTAPIVARQSMWTRRISPDGMRRVAQSPSLAISVTLVPAERPI